MKISGLRTGIFLAGFCCCATMGWSGDVWLLAAGSTKEALNEAADVYTRHHPETKIARKYGASGTLARQIESGLPADIFVSAGPEWIDYLAHKEAIDPEGATCLAYNQMVFVGLPASGVRGIGEIVRLDRIAIGSPKSAPCGAYALQALQKAGLSERLAGKMVLAKDVREAFMYAERGEVGGAFVYKTDALLASNTQILFTVPPELSGRIGYHMGQTRRGAKNADAKAFCVYLQSVAAQKILGRHGFGMP